MKKIILLAAVIILALPSFAQDNFFSQDELDLSTLNFTPSGSYFTSDPSILNQSNLRYKALKSYYNKNDYKSLTSPKYGLGLPWLNLILPGLGQYCMSEPGLGTTYLLLSLGSGVVVSTGYVLTNATMLAALSGDLTEDQTAKLFSTGSALMVVGSICSLAVTITSIVNAYSVAKVKSLYMDDLNHFTKGYSFSVAPTVSLAMTPNGYVPAPGLGLSVKF